MEAVAYYEGETSSLGGRLWDEVERHIAWIARKLRGAVPEAALVALRSGQKITD
jgi:hypothetical protein